MTKILLLFSLALPLEKLWLKTNKATSLLWQQHCYLLKQHCYGHIGSF